VWGEVELHRSSAGAGSHLFQARSHKNRLPLLGTKGEPRTRTYDTVRVCGTYNSWCTTELAAGLWQSWIAQIRPRYVHRVGIVGLGTGLELGRPGWLQANTTEDINMGGLKTKERRITESGSST
jgi:hypothetical protein